MTRAEKVWRFIQQHGSATVTDLRREFGLSAGLACSAVRHLYRQGCLVRQPDKFSHGRRFLYSVTNHPPPGQGYASLAMRPIVVAPEKLPMVRL